MSTNARRQLRPVQPAGKRRGAGANRRLYLHLMGMAILTAWAVVLTYGLMRAAQYGAWCAIETNAWILYTEIALGAGGIAYAVWHSKKLLRP